MARLNVSVKEIKLILLLIDYQLIFLDEKINESYNEKHKYAMIEKKRNVLHLQITIKESLNNIILKNNIDDEIRKQIKPIIRKSSN